MIKLRDPKGNARDFDPPQIALVFFWRLLSPAKASNSVLCNGRGRNLPGKAIAAIGASAKLIGLTLPDLVPSGRSA